LTNGEEVIIDDGVGDQLNYTLVKGSHKLIEKDETTGTYYWSLVPMVVYDSRNYYFPEDRERGAALGSHDIEGKTDSTDAQRVTYNTVSSTGQIQFNIESTPDEEGNYYFYVTLPSTARGLKNGFKNNTHLKAVVYTKHFSLFDITGMYTGCTSLEYAYIDSNTISLSGTSANYPFHGDTQLQTLFWKVDPLFTDEVPDTSFINDCPSWTYIYVPAETLVDYRAMNNFKNYTLLKI
jgi:hypothetical protein